LTTAPEPLERRPLLVSKWWVQTAVLVFLLGFFVLGLLAYRTYTEQPPVPETVVDERGTEVFTRSDVTEGQNLFLRYGLMQ
jgi:nitric oxide reductase subunit B